MNRQPKISNHQLTLYIDWFVIGFLFGVVVVVIAAAFVVRAAIRAGRAAVTEAYNRGGMSVEW